MIYENIGLDQFLNLAIAIYPTLLRHRMVPELTLDTIASMAGGSPLIMTRSNSAVARMPMELWLHIAEYGEPANSVALHWALGLRFWRSYNQLSNELVVLLRRWSQQTSKKK
jgi:hypothetical protein